MVAEPSWDLTGRARLRTVGPALYCHLPPPLPFLTVMGSPQCGKYMAGGALFSADDPRSGLLHSSQVVNEMLDRTSSGTFGSNDGFTYLTLPSLPLGGVGESCLPPPCSPHPQGSLG